jgi:cystathionine beta-lyase/cystathionine gamma-synthase
MIFDECLYHSTVTLTLQRLTPGACNAMDIGDGMLCLSMGLEDVDDLAAGLAAAARS